MTEYSCVGDFTAAAAYRCGLELLRLPLPPTAIFTCNNRLTLGLALAMYEMLVARPNDLSVVAFDDFPWEDSFQTRLTTIRQPTYDLGRKAVELLIAKIECNPENPDAAPDPNLDTMVVLKNQLIMCESTTPTVDREQHAVGRREKRS